MGWMEGLRGVGVMSLAVFTMWVFSRFAPDDSTSLKTVIIIYSVVYILLGILCWFLLAITTTCAVPITKKNSHSSLATSGRLRISTTVLQHGDFWRLHHLRHSELLHQLSDRNVWHVAGGGELHGDLINKIFRALCGPRRHNHHLQQSEILYPRDPNPSVLGLLTLTALLVTNSNPQSVAMGIGLILLLGFTCYASRGLYWACRRSENTVLHYGHHGRYLFGDWIPAGCLRLPNYRPLARHPARCRSLPQYVADGHGGAWHGDCLYLLLFQKFVLLIAPPQWLAASKPENYRRKIMSEKIHHRD